MVLARVKMIVKQRHIRMDTRIVRDPLGTPIERIPGIPQTEPCDSEGFYLEAVADDDPRADNRRMWDQEAYGSMQMHNIRADFLGLRTGQEVFVELVVRRKQEETGAVVE